MISQDPVKVGHLPVLPQAAGQHDLALAHVFSQFAGSHPDSLHFSGSQIVPWHFADSHAFTVLTFI